MLKHALGLCTANKARNFVVEICTLKFQNRRRTLTTQTMLGVLADALALQITPEDSNHHVVWTDTLPGRKFLLENATFDVLAMIIDPDARLLLVVVGVV
jgi:hypothetical protein